MKTILVPEWESIDKWGWPISLGGDEFVLVHVTATKNLFFDLPATFLCKYDGCSLIFESGDFLSKHDQTIPGWYQSNEYPDQAYKISLVMEVPAPPRQ